MPPGNTQFTLLAWIQMNAPFIICQDAVPKCRAFTHQMVQFLSSLEQNGKITLAVLEKEMSKLLDDIIVFNPPGEWPMGHHVSIQWVNPCSCEIRGLGRTLSVLFPEKWCSERGWAVRCWCEINGTEG